MTCFVAQSVPDGLLERHIFRMVPRRAAVRCDGLAGQWWRGTSSQRPSGHCRATYCLGRLCAMARTTPLPWQESSPWTPTLHIGCEGTIATINGPKFKALAAGCPRAPVWSRLLGSHEEVRAIKVKGHATQRDVEAGRSSHLFKRGKRLCRYLCKEKGRHTHKPAFRVAKTLVACASLAKQAARWVAEAHVMLRSKCWNDTQAAAPRPRMRPPRARTKRKRREVAALPATGPASDWLSPSFPRFSRKTVISTHALSKGTEYRWGEFSVTGAEYWTEPSFFAPSAGQCTEKGRTRCAAAPRNILEVAQPNFAN